MPSTTTPTRKPYTSADALWGSGISSGHDDEEDGPDDSEIIAGLSHGTGITSALFQWILAMVGEWCVKIKDSLFPQHNDDGNHFEVVATADQNNTPLKIGGHTGTTSSVPALEILDEIGGTQVAKITHAGDLIANTVGQSSSSVRQRVISGRAALQPVSSGTLSYGTSTMGIAYTDIDNTTRRFVVNLSKHLPTFAEITAVKVVTTIGDSANRVDATMRRTDSGDNSTSVSAGSITRITGSTGIQTATLTNTAPAGTYAGQNSFELEIDQDNRSGSASYAIIEKLVVSYTVGTLG